jgi:hypothetical protein
MSGIFAQAIGLLAGGRVLDVATGRGTFAGLLATYLQSRDDVKGIDTSVRALTAARGGRCFPPYHTLAAVATYRRCDQLRACRPVECLPCAP